MVWDSRRLREFGWTISTRCVNARAKAPPRIIAHVDRSGTITSLNQPVPNADRGTLRNAIHHFVSGFCGVVLGITPPPEDKEIPFVAAVVAILAAIAFALLVVTWFLFGTIVRR